jgi:peptidoglycan/LPS O-acetylase OafA/YrhL
VHDSIDARLGGRRSRPGDARRDQPDAPRDARSLYRPDDTPRPSGRRRPWDPPPSEGDRVHDLRPAAPDPAGGRGQPPSAPVRRAWDDPAAHAGTDTEGRFGPAPAGGGTAWEAPSPLRRPRRPDDQPTAPAEPHSWKDGGPATSARRWDRGGPATSDDRQPPTDEVRSRDDRVTTPEPTERRAEPSTEPRAWADPAPTTAEPHTWADPAPVPAATPAPARGPGPGRGPATATRHPVERPAPGRLDLGPRLPHVPGFDGLRAVALLAVLAFHQGYDLLRGGFLGISSFFTLSGFLIATLALAEWAENGHVAVFRFWERRARRLIPPAVLVLAVVVALQTALRVGAGPGFRGDVVAAAGQVLNWRFAFGGDGFASVLTDPSPVQHFWSVSIAAQVFLLFPLVFVGLMRLANRRWRATGAVFGLAAAGSFVLAAATADRSGNDGLAYYGLHTRVGEVLVGVTLAYAVLSPTVRRVMATPNGALVLRYGPFVVGAGLLWLWTTTSLYSSNLFGGVTAVNAVLTAFLVLALTTPSPVTTALGARPLQLLGEMAYAAYLLHWPIYLLLDEDRTGLDSHLLFAARLAATLALAALSTWAFERPLRYRFPVPRAQLGVALTTSLAVVAAAALLLPEQPPRNVSLTIDNGDGPGDLDAVAPASGGDEAVSIALVGDGLAETMTPGFEQWNADRSERQVRVHTHVAAGCPVSAPGPVRLAGDSIGEGSSCAGFAPRLPKLLDAAGADAIVVVGGLADLGEREIDREWRTIGDPVFDEWLRHHYDDLADTLAEQDVPVLWATYPHVRLTPGNDGEGDWTTVADNDPLRVERLNEIIGDTVSGREGFTVVDLDAWSQDLPRGGAFSSDFRLEGRDLTEAGAREAARWLMPKVLEATDTEPAGD